MYVNRVLVKQTRSRIRFGVQLVIRLYEYYIICL